MVGQTHLLYAAWQEHDKSARHASQMAIRAAVVEAGASESGHRRHGWSHQ